MYRLDGKEVHERVLRGGKSNVVHVENCQKLAVARFSFASNKRNVTEHALCYRIQLL